MQTVIRPFVLGTSHLFIRYYPDWLMPWRNGRCGVRESNWGLIETQAGKDRIDWEIDLKSGGTVWVSWMLITGPPETEGVGASRRPWKLPKWSHPKCTNLQRLQSFQIDHFMLSCYHGLNVRSSGELATLGWMAQRESHSGCIQKRVHLENEWI